MKSRTTTYAVALGLASTLALAGCNGGDNDPNGTPTPTSSSTSSASPTGSVTSAPAPTTSSSIDLPSAARAHTEAGAIAFSKFFITSLDKGYVSQDASVIEALSAPNCGGCQGAITVLKGLKSSNERQAKAAVSIAGAEYVPLNGDEVVDVFASYAAVDRIRDGKVIGNEPAHKTAFRLTLAWINSGWKMQKTDVLGD